MSASEPAARALGFWTSAALVVGNTIGVGIFVMPAALAPFGLNALTGWLIIVVGLPVHGGGIRRPRAAPFHRMMARTVTCGALWGTVPRS